MIAEANIWSALVHFPVLDKAGARVTTSVTNMDVHDLSRSSRTFELKGFFIVTPIGIHRQMVQKVAAYWQEPSCGNRTPSRKEALGLVAVADSIEAAAAVIEGEAGKKPDIIGTTAKRRKGAVPCTVMRKQISADPQRPRLILFGTGWGLSPEVLDACTAVLEPVEGAGDYAHLSVRSAAAIVLDRLLGRR
ncbi:MAG: RNA methyltransferase [Pseudomonadota bacterium]